MKLYPICASCNLGSMATLMDKLGIKENRWDIMRKLLKKASEVPEDYKPVELYKVLYDELTGGTTEDIWKEEKKQMNDVVLEIYPYLESLVNSANNPIKMAARLSAIGNIIDIGVHGHSWGDMKHEVEKSLSFPFFIDQRDIFIEALSDARSLLLIGDNAGEIVFDRLLLETIHKTFPNIEIYVGVRGIPLLNDITEDDALYAGINKEWIINTGVDLPGFVPSRANSEAQTLLREVDIVISKGQGNFEGLSEYRRDNLFFVLRAKCVPVATEWKASVGALIFGKRT